MDRPSSESPRRNDRFRQRNPSAAAPGKGDFIRHVSCDSANFVRRSDSFRETPTLFVGSDTPKPQMRWQKLQIRRHDHTIDGTNYRCAVNGQQASTLKLSLPDRCVRYLAVIQ